MKKCKDQKGTKVDKKQKGGFKKMLIKIFLWILFICLVTLLAVVGINLYMTNSVSENVISLEDAKDMDADCIIVLGAGVRKDGSPTNMLEDRIIIGDRLYKDNAAGKILMSGDHGRENYDEVKLRMEKGKKDKIKSHADAAGESMNGFINRAIDETMERDNKE